MQRTTFLSLLLLGLVYSDFSFAFRSPSSIGHSEFLERCQLGLQHHPQMQFAPSSVLGQVDQFCQCSLESFQSQNGEISWPFFDRTLILKSFDSCLFELSVMQPQSYQWIGSILFDIWIGRDLDDQLMRREPAGIGHFIAFDDLQSERQCVRENMIKSCFQGELHLTYQCLKDQVSDPDHMNQWSVKCKSKQINVDMPML